MKVDIQKLVSMIRNQKSLVYMLEIKSGRQYKGTQTEIQKKMEEIRKEDRFAVFHFWRPGVKSWTPNLDDLIQPHEKIKASTDQLFVYENPNLWSKEGDKHVWSYCTPEQVVDLIIQKRALGLWVYDTTNNSWVHGSVHPEIQPLLMSEGHVIPVLEKEELLSLHAMSPTWSPYSGKLSWFDIYAPVTPSQDVPYEFNFIAQRLEVLTEKQRHEIYESILKLKTPVQVPKEKIDVAVRAMWSIILMRLHKYSQSSIDGSSSVLNGFVVKNIFSIRQGDDGELLFRWSAFLDMNKQKYWKEERALRNMKYWSRSYFCRTQVSHRRRLSWMVHRFSGLPLVDCFYIVQEYWNVYVAQLMNGRAHFTVGSQHHLPTDVPYVFRFIKQCQQILDDVTLWKDNKLIRMQKMIPYNGSSFRIDVATSRDSMQEFVKWLQNPERLYYAFSEKLDPMRLTWIVNKKSTREYAFFEGRFPDSNRLISDQHRFRWKGLYLHRDAPKKV